ncbi:MAG TPA: hypothetical protein VGE72_29990 [Azospirillum sp.]
MSTDFDLGALEMGDTGELVVRDPRTQDPILGANRQPWTLLLAGPGHKNSIDAKNEQTRKALRRARMKGDQGDDPKAVEADNLAYMMKRLLGWRNPPPLGGAPFEHSPENATRLLTDPRYAWFKDLVNRGLQDDAVFMSSSATS